MGEVHGGGWRGGAWWEGDELAVNQSILRGWRVRLRLGTWGAKRLRRKGGFRARIEARFAVWGQAARGGGVRVLTSGSLGVKEPAFLGVGKNGQILIFTASPTSSAGARSAWRSIKH